MLLPIQAFAGYPRLGAWTYNPGKYIQQRVIGEGTYGRVHACEDTTEKDRLVAIKVFKENTHDEQVLSHFLRPCCLLRVVW